jgi:hypothetical protein
MLKGTPEDWLTLQRRWREQFKEEYRGLRRAAAAAKVGGVTGFSDRRAKVAAGPAEDSQGCSR